MKMTILRARRTLEMNVDLETTTEIENIEVADGEAGAFTTVYGTESAEGTLWYLVLDDAAVLGLILAYQEHQKNAKPVDLPPENSYGIPPAQVVHAFAEISSRSDRDFIRCEKKEHNGNASRRCALASNHRTQHIFGAWIVE